jgi:hypothetical protein
MKPPLRPASQRRVEALRRLEHDLDAWVATARDDLPFLAPLSFLWDGATLLISVPTASPTSRNLLANGKVRVSIGEHRNVVLITGEATPIAVADIAKDVGDAFAAKCGFDPRGFRTSFTYFRIVPTRLQAWRDVPEVEGRDLMRDGVWLVEG